LLGDIAVPLLAAGKPGYANVLADWRAGKGDLADLEQNAYGWTHNVVTGWYSTNGDFPTRYEMQSLKSADPRILRCSTRWSGWFPP
jgi:hypothetical protein